MCGIVGLFLKTNTHHDELGRLTALMLHEMRERGPDSAGFAIYDADDNDYSKSLSVFYDDNDNSEPSTVLNDDNDNSGGVPEGANSDGADATSAGTNEGSVASTHRATPINDSNITRITVLVEGRQIDWTPVIRDLENAIAAEVNLQTVHDHAVLTTTGNGRAARRWLIDNTDVSVLSYGQRIELYKSVGDPEIVAERYGLPERVGTHAIAHTRMATESAITTQGSHPFVTGADTCLVHNGSLSNHNTLRRWLERHGETFQTDNDSEVAAGYLAHKLQAGSTLDQALSDALDDLDGFYTFAIGTADGFAVLRDPIACKPAVVAETDDWVAMSSEYRAIAQLPNAAHAEVWEPEPARVYTWSLAA